MKPQLLDKLVDPLTHESLRLDGDALRAPGGASYPIVGDIPRFVFEDDEGQTQTRDAFGFKWKRRDTYDSPASAAAAAEWMVEKYGLESIDAWAESFDRREAVLDAGCGSGFSSSIWLSSPRWSGRAMWVGVDISSAIDVAQERLGRVANTHFVQGDVLRLPFADEAFDAVFSEGVLHHTPSTRAALLSVCRVLASGGEIAFYVYKKKGPVREFTDDCVREQIAPLSDEEAWEAMRSLTELGRVLAEAEVTVDVPRDVPLLGIRAGRQDVQRLIYWNFAKLYWNPRLSFEENVHVNFDWYRPRYAHRQTESEVRGWCEEARLDVTWFHDAEAGFAVRATKR